MTLAPTPPSERPAFRVLTAAAVGAAGAAAALGTFLVFGYFATPAPANAPWRPVTDPVASFDLTSPAFEGLPRRTFASEREGVRSEWLMISALAAPGPVAAVELRTGPAPVIDARPLRERLSNLWMLRAAITDYTDGYLDFAVRAGLLRALPFSAKVDGVERHCAGFQGVASAAPYLLSGFVCDAPGRPPDAGRLACLIDGITINPPLARLGAGAALAARLAEPPSCGAGPVGAAIARRVP